jgi:hypothetical protein
MLVHAAVVVVVVVACLLLLLLLLACSCGIDWGRVGGNVLAAGSPGWLLKLLLFMLSAAAPCLCRGVKPAWLAVDYMGLVVLMLQLHTARDSHAQLFARLCCWWLLAAAASAVIHKTVAPSVSQQGKVKLLKAACI